MKKMMLSLTILLGAAALVAAFSSPAAAAVSGRCDNCHTMHSSQGGSTPDLWTSQTVTYEDLTGSLLVTDCVGCHLTTGTNPYDDTASSPTPYVYVGTGSGYLAGGYFTDGGGSHDDNSHTIDSPDDPAGWTSGEGAFGDYDGGTTGLECAGQSGCHGVQSETDEAKAIAGGHHENTLKMALGYRMLMVGTDAVVGIEASDYEKELNANTTFDESEDHNLYSANQTAANTASISELCGKCHSAFHGDDSNSDIYTSNAWIRHPTDTIIPTTAADGWEIQYGVTATEYTAEDWRYNPVGTQGAAAPGVDNKYVTCLSCHRAHGSEYNDILRFDYSAQEASSATVDTGCLGCHDRQRNQS